MSDVMSALNGASSDGLVSVKEVQGQGMVTLRADLSDVGLTEAIAGACGVAVPGQRLVASDGARRLAWMSPDELLLLCPAEEVGPLISALTRALDGRHALVADVSDARAMFDLSGPHLRDVLAKLAPVDLSADAFAPGQIRRTRLAQVACAFWFESENDARLICFRSVADYVFGLLSNAAAPGGAVGYFTR